MDSIPSSGNIEAGSDIHATNVVTGIQQNFTVIFHQPFTPPPNLTQLRTDYLAYLRDSYRYLDMQGIRQVQQVTYQLGLTDVYVPLKAHAGQAAATMRVAGRQGFREGTAAPDALADGALARHAEPVPVEVALPRYVDDFLLFSDQKRQLWNWRQAIIDVLGHLRLTVHERSSTVYPVTNGIPFLGFVTYPSHRLLKRRNGIAFARRFRQQLHRLAARWSMMLLPPRCAAGWPTLPMGIPMACGEHWSPGRLFPEAQRGTIAHFCAHL